MTTTNATKAIDKLLRRMEREYAAAIRHEEAADDLQVSWRRAAASDRALRRLQLVRAGQPLPPPPATARNRARGAYAALATIGRSIARAIQCASALKRAQAAAAVARVARQAAKAARSALRNVLRTVVAAVLAPAVKLANSVTVDADGTVSLVGRPLSYTLDNGAKLRAELRGSFIVFTGGFHGEHSIAADASISSGNRINNHWSGYVANNIVAVARGAEVA